MVSWRVFEKCRVDIIWFLSLFSFHILILQGTSMPLTEPNLWIFHIRVFDLSHVTRIPRIEVVPDRRIGNMISFKIRFFIIFPPFDILRFPVQYSAVQGCCAAARFISRWNWITIPRNFVMVSQSLTGFFSPGSFSRSYRIKLGCRVSFHFPNRTAASAP